jgi:RNA polymerase sigma-70 factor (ECF subfamily)
MDSQSNRLNLNVLLTRVAQDDAAARDELLGVYRPYLRLLAMRQLPRLVRKRLDASDIVQQTLVDAVRGLPDFRGQSEPEFTAWMMRLLERNLLMSVRNNTVAKRDIRLEQSWTDGSGSAVLMWHSLAADGSSPMSSVFRGEAALLLAIALEKLPVDQRTAVKLRYIEQLSFQTIADEMSRTLGSVAHLIRRGLETLETYLPSEFGELKGGS